MSWTLIEHQALTSSVASVTLGSGGTIPQTYKTLKLLVSARNNASTTNEVRISFNGSATNFSHRYLVGTGVTTASGISGTSNYFGDIPKSTDTANTFGNGEMTIPNYAGSTNKPMSTDIVTENNGTTAYQEMWAQLWSNTAAITSITLSMNVDAFASGSTFTLYGLA